MAATKSGSMPDAKVPILWKVTGTLCRSLFLLGLILVTARISLPDNLSTAALAHLSIADFVRAAIGIAVCLFALVQLFRRPRDDYGYKAWSFIGLALLAVAILFVALHGWLPGHNLWGHEP